MSETTMERLGWTLIDCGCCNGIEWGGEEPRTCRDCGGNGVLWRSPRGRLALYPGGPFRGIDTTPVNTKTP